MKEEDSYKTIMTAMIMVALIVLSFLILRPILFSMIFGIILVFIFNPLNERLLKRIKSKNLSAIICSLILVLIITLPIIFLTPLAIDQSIRIYLASQNTDFVFSLQNFLKSSSIITEEFSQQIGSTVNSFLQSSTHSLLNMVTSFILNLPILLLKLVVTLFTFFFVLRDKENFLTYIKDLLPFSKQLEKELVKCTGEVAFSVLYGQILIGILQGLVVGLGFIIFGVPNAPLLMILAIFVGIFPIVGPFLVWIPVSIYLIASGNGLSAIGVIIFGSIASIGDNFLRPIVVSKKTSLNPLFALIGMIGGLLLFGVLGIILGPLIIAYFLIFLELYRNKRISGLLIERRE